MKITDINWNGTIVDFTYNDIEIENLPVESEVSLNFDSNVNKYYLSIDLKSYYVTPSVSGQGILESIVKNKSFRDYIAWIIDVSKKSISIKICPFASSQYLNEFQGLSIEISPTVVQQLKQTTAANAIPIIENQFAYNNSRNERVVFIIGISKFDSQKEEKAFTIVSGKNRLTISKVNGKLVAVKYSRQNGDIYQPISAIYGNINFSCSGEATIISEATTKQLQNALQATGYLSMWNEYNNLEKLLITQEAKEYGYTEYSSYSIEMGSSIVYKFKIASNQFHNIDDTIEIDTTDDKSITQENPQDVVDGTLQSQIRSNFVGTFLKCEGGFIYVVDKNGITPKKNLPNHGYLFKSIFGDKKRLKRRDIAKKTIASGKSPISSLNLLVNDGISTEKAKKDYPAITPQLKKSLRDKNGDEINFNEQQEHAIKIALNTPDIALIQGPPGTGKTTVIKAIIARFEEIYKKETNGDYPKILVTSFQHVAVDNAINGIDFSGMPANRFGGKRGEENPYKKIVENWAIKVCNSIDEYVKSHGTGNVHNAVEELKNRIFAWKNKGMDIHEGLDILQNVLTDAQFFLSDLLRNRIQHLLILRPTSAVKMVKSVMNDDLTNFIESLNRLRLTQTSFFDDGLQNLQDFVDDLELGMFDSVYSEKSIPNFIKTVISTNGSDTDAFSKYVNFVKEMLEKFTPDDVEDQESDLSELIENCLFDSIDETKNYLLKKLENIEEAKCEILLQYKDELLSGSAEQIIADYTDIFASTCQQCASRPMQNTPEYDLVIVDEAARANPLDLFIPMSMAKKIILVGDHQQLPHMLEPSIEKQLGAVSTERLNLYKKSFFQHLFEKLKQPGDEHSPFAKTCTLNYQYRMLPVIGDYVSKTIYDGNLHCGLSEEYVSSHFIDIPEYNGKSVVWYNVGRGKDNELMEEAAFSSKQRLIEVETIFNQIKKIAQSGASVSSIGIITFYKAQADLFKSEFDNYISRDIKNKINEIEIGTVDAFQGKEYDVVFLSCVRCNNEKDQKKKVGFLQDKNRLCVALSRGKNLLIAVGDEETVSNVDILNDYIHYCRNEKGCYCGNT